MGCGPGFAASEIARMVGRGGAVALLDESPRWHRILASREFEAPTVQLETTIEDAALESGAHDLVYSRWVMSFLPDIDAVCRKVLGTLRPGGAFVVQDYNHDGVAVFPRSEGFEAVAPPRASTRTQAEMPGSRRAFPLRFDGRGSSTSRSGPTSRQEDRVGRLPLGGRLLP